MTAFRTLDDLDPKGQRVLVRVDLNVPMEGGRVTDDTRIRAVLPTIREIADQGGKVILLAHFGRPKGGPEAKYSLRQLVVPLAEALGRPVALVEDCVGPDAEETVADMVPGDILLLENTRFHAGEEKNDGGFTGKLARLGDAFVNDAFATAHRAHASTAGLADHLPAYAGRCMQAEIEALEKALAAPQRPVLAVVGGAKVSSKLELLENLVGRVDMLVIGGGMANTFLLAEGIPVGKSLAEPDLVGTARRISEKTGRAWIAPVHDVVVAEALRAGVATETVAVGRVPADKMILDFGPETIAEVLRAVDAAKTVVWNGPLGAFETAPFDRATTAVARRVAERTRAGELLSVAGGGDTVAALAKAGVVDDFSYVSTAGGAFLEWLEGKTLPGVEALRRR